MKLLFDARYIAISGGIKKFVLTFIEGVLSLEHKNIAFLFCHSHKNEAIVRRLQGLGYQILFIHSKPFQPTEHIELQVLLLANSVCVYHVPHFNVPLINLNNTKVISTIHDLTFNYYEDEFRSKFHKFYYYITLKKAMKSEVIVAISKATRSSIIEMYGRSDVEVIYNGFILTHQHDEISTREKSKFLYVGNNKYRKNLKFLIKVFQKLPQDYHLIVIGDMRDHKYDIKQDIQEKQLEDKVILKGFVSDEELLNNYRTCTALIMPSLLEGFGYPVLEGAMYKIPVLASSYSSLPELGGENGCLYFDPKDENDCMEKIKSIVNNPNLRAELVYNNFKRPALFTKENCVRGYLKVYDSIA